MAKLDLIAIVNDIANDLDTDPVNSIEDTVESVQIAQIVKSTYFEIMANRNWPHLKKTTRFTGLADTSTPTHLSMPELTKELIMFSYNKATEEAPAKKRYEELKYLTPEEFLAYTNKRNTDNSNVVEVTDFGGANFLILNDKQPTYFTSFDDEYIVLDSYNSALESTLQGSNSQAIIYLEPSWVHLDNAIPDLPSEAFPLLIEEAKSTASLVIRQEASIKAEQRARRQNIFQSRKAWKVAGGIEYPDYGRK